MAGHGKVVGDFQGVPDLHFDAFVLDVVHHQFGQGFHVGCYQGDAPGAQHLEAVDQGAGAGDDAGFGFVVAHHLAQARLGFTVVAASHRHDSHQAGIAQYINPGVGQLEGATVGLGVHGGQLFFLHMLHAHARGVVGEAFRADQLARAEHRRDFGFHRGVGARHDLANAIEGVHVSLRIS
ncbi:hypothetical protein D3C86_1481980 [compost metagenome]